MEVLFTEEKVMPKNKKSGLVPSGRKTSLARRLDQAAKRLAEKESPRRRLFFPRGI